MQFTALLAKLTDFVNLGKFLVDAAPGVLLATALMLFGSSWARLPLVPAEVQDGTTTVASRYERRLEQVRGRIGRAEDDFEKRTKADATAVVELERAKADLQAFDAIAKELGDTQRERMKRALVGAGGGVLSQEQIKAEAERRKLEKTVIEGTGERARTEKQLAVANRALEKLYEKEKELEEQEVTSLGGFFSLLLDHLFALTLVGWILGLIMSPVNRVFLLDRKSKIDVPGPKSLINVETVQKEQKATATKLAEEHHTSYFIGRGIISKTEWDGVVTAYYRWAELSLNLVVPVMVMSLAISYTAWNSQNLGVSGVVPLLVVIVGLLASLSLFLLGRSQYAKYKVKMKDFTVGHIEAYLADTEAQASGQTKTLGEVVQLADDLLKKAKNQKGQN